LSAIAAQTAKRAFREAGRDSAANRSDRMRYAYHPDYHLPLPPAHPFPMAKYPLLHERLVARGWLRPEDRIEPAEAALEDLARVHTAEYLARLESGTLDAAEVRRIGVPWSSRLWRRSRLAAQGTLEAARAALEDGRAGNLAGGTHHAFADHGEGFCVLNDVAIAIRRLQHDGSARRALVVDLDVHQGNGTAAIFADDPDVYTFSMHGERNYPVRKMRSTLDVGLGDGVGDDQYLALLRQHLGRALAEASPDVVFYLAGVDPVAGDRYGRLALSEAGLREREREVLGACRDRPLVVTIAGGYASTPERTAELHAVVFEEARRAAAAPLRSAAGASASGTL
jgi:acetoin utilization deacetylase AcuC-like enzyme